MEFLNIIQSCMDDELVFVSLFFTEARDTVATLFGGAKFSFEKRIVFRANDSKVK